MKGKAVVARIGLLVAWLLAASPSELAGAHASILPSSLLSTPSSPLLEPDEAVLTAGRNESGRFPVPDTAILTWAGGPDNSLIRIPGIYAYGGAQRYTAPRDLTVKSLLFYITEGAYGASVYVAGQGTDTQPGPRLDSANAIGISHGCWRHVDMRNCPSIAVGHDFWGCVIFRRFRREDRSVLAVDSGPMIQDRGGFITLPDIGPQWFQLNEPPFWIDRNWCIAAVVEYSSGVSDEHRASSNRQRTVVSPSPVRTVAHISYMLRERTPVNLSIYDANGRLVCTLVNGVVGSGLSRATWDCTGRDGRRVASGTYFYCLSAAGTLHWGKIIVLD